VKDMVLFSAGELAQHLDRSLNKTDLIEIWFNPIKDFLRNSLHRTFQGEKMDQLVGRILVNPSVTKVEYLDFCSKFYSNEEALKAFYEYLPPDHQKLVENLCWNESVGMADLEKLYNRPIFGVKEINSRYDFGNGFELVADPLLNHWKKFIRRDTFYSFQVNKANDFLARVNPRVEFPILLRKVFSSILPKPEGFYFNSIELPLGITIFQAGETIFNDLPLISTYYFQGKIGYSQKGYPIQTSIKKMVKSIPLEPLPGDGDGSLRHYLMAGLFSSRFKISTINDSQINTIQQLFKSNFFNFNLTPVFLKHLKGIIQVSIESQYNATLEIKKLFIAMPLEQWITFENIKVFAEAHFLNLNIASFYQLERLSLDFGNENIDYSFNSIKGRVKECVTIPNLAGHIYLMAAFGLMDIGVDLSKKQNYSPYDGLFCCRLTKLGAYILGLTEDFTPPKSDTETSLSFDERSTIIRVEGNIRLVDTMMESYAVKVSENRYQFSPEKFLNDCKTSKNLENKIKLFKQTVNQKLPPFWENYFNQLLENSKCIVNTQQIIVFRLPTTDKDLHRIVAQDPELRKLIIKAEQFHILVYDSNKAAFVSRMKVLGYLVN
jgi:hypothetical protein